MEENYELWQYHRDSYCSLLDALKERYPQTLAEDTLLQAAVNQITIAELAINTRMEQLRDLHNTEV